MNLQLSVEHSDTLDSVFLPMDQLPDEPVQSQTFTPFNRRWEDLRSTIERLYIDENHELSDLIEIMKEQHNFDAK